MSCEENYIECDIKSIGIEQLIRLMVVLDGNGNPALRSCADNSALGGVTVDHFIATAGQTNFTVSNPIKKNVAWFRNGAIKHEPPVSAVIDGTTVVLPPQPLGTEITIIS
ncbi:MAG: hypothetical protein KC589_09365 [Nanoarchaeota archaeon]|nr:hypothetical protein [Nanoarchaeota archaeon]